MKVIANNIGSQSVYLTVLQLRSFRSLWFGQICSQFAINTLLFVLAIRIYQTTGSNTAVSGLFLAHSVPAVLFGLIAGTLVDRLDKRKVIIVCDLIRASFALSLLFLSHQVIVVYILTFFNSLITQLYVPSEAPLIPQLVPKKLLVSANSMFAFTFYSSLALGSVMAGPLLRLFGSGGFFVFIASLFGLSSFFSSRISSQSTGTVGFRYLAGLSATYLFSRVWFRLRDGIGYVRKSAELFDAILLLTGTQIVFAILGSLGPGFADQGLGIDIRDASLLLVGPVVLGIVSGSLWVGQIGYRYRAAQLIKIGITSVGVLLIIIAGTSKILHISAFQWLIGSNLMMVIELMLFFALGVANSFLDVPANATLQSETNSDMRGRVYGILAAFVGGVGLIPVIVGGALADIIGVGNVIFLLGLGIIGYAIYRLRYNGV